MRRVSISMLMGVVLMCAVAVAALKNPSELWSGVMRSITLLLLGTAGIAAAYRRAARRAFWIGFAAFGWGYMFFALSSRVPEVLRPPTTELLVYAHERMAPTPSVPVPMYGKGMMGTGGMPGMPGIPSMPGTFAAQANTMLPPAQVLFVSPADREQFLIIGHCLFALLVALTGAGIARWFHRSNPIGGP